MSAIFGETLTFEQENGPDVKLVVFGDESYARYENEDGYTVVYDSDLGLYCYADLINGEFVSSGVSQIESPPARVRRHFKESGEVRNAKFEARHALMIPPPDPYRAPDTMRTLGPSKGLLEGRRVIEGKVNGLTILVQFQDVKSTVTAEEVSDILNGQDYSENGNFCSVREYYLKMSNGKLDYTNEVVGPITLSHNRQYYVQHQLFKEALDAVVNRGIDLAQFDSRGEGIIDALSFLYAGQTQYRDWLWPHNFVLDLQYGDIRTYFYMISSLGRTKSDLSIGTFCHENGHMLCRFPDLYDYGGRDGDFEESAGLGHYCLMSSGNHNNRGRTPSPICAYLRNLVGWCDNKVVLNKPGKYQITHGDYGTAIVFETCYFNEYFLVENRSKLDLDEHIPSSGLAVYHCDIFGSNEWQGGTPRRHYQCGLLQADGHLDLEKNRGRGGDPGDMFGREDGIALSHSTNPHSRQWDGSDSGLIISKISELGEVISFVVGPAEATVKVVSKESFPKLDIPDDDPTGVRNAIAIDEEGTMRKVTVDVDISHTYIGDLRVELFTPAGKQAILHNRTGFGQDNLIKTYDSGFTVALADLAGQSIKGNWILQVTDLEGRDIGKLNKWSLELAYSG
ncbi:MAG: M6 family metalloprotease domain-containing protein [Methanophagales archaeon]|nr:M6 family metalloprotease domain-containing protein [Methanophagales archaeon]